MKLRLVLVVLLLLPLFLKGQSDVIFYSKGKTYVKYKDIGNPAEKGDGPSTTLYISGSAKFATGAAIMQKGRTEITGNFINAKDPDDNTEDSPQLFVGKANNDEKDGVIAFIGTAQQHIYGTKSDGSAISLLSSADSYTKNQKKNKWIDFPTISIEKKTNNNLLVNVSAAISVDYIRANGNNRLAVNADGVTEPLLVNTGFARVKNVYSTTASDPVALATYSEVDLKLYKYGGGEDDGAFEDSGIPNRPRPVVPTTPDGTALRTGTSNPNGGAGWNRLTGFTPPFEQLGADYMFYHTLTKPSGSSITSWEGPIVDPLFRMKAGRGYFISMEVSHANHTAGPDNINDRWSHWNVKSDNRARGGYTFNRRIFYDNAAIGESMEGFSRFLYDAVQFATGKAYPTGTVYPVAGLGGTYIEGGKDRSRYELMTQEKFNTGAVEVDLEQGLNFLGNPFMAPISLNPLLGFNANPESDGTTYAELTEASTIANGFRSTLFSPDQSNKVIISSVSPTADVRAKYWMINQALVKYDPIKNIYNYKTTYDFVSRDGTSAVYGVQDGRAEVAAPIINPLQHVISPMQMFCLQASKPITIKLDPELQVFGLTRFTKSAEATKASVSSDNSSVMKDWFIVEAKSNNGVADRATVIFNDNAKIQYKEDAYDTRKGISEAFETYVDEVNGKPTKTSFEQSKAIVYTKSSDQENLLGNAIPTQTKELALYFMPPSSTQEMTLKFYGLENIESVPGVWLVDRYLDNKAVKITPETEYTFVSEAASNSTSEVNDNRFILRFYDAGGSVIDNEQKAISCYYNSSTLYISGLIEDDVNSDVVIYDMQGRLMGRTKITELQQPWSYVKPLNIGTYIVKITGKRNHTVKFVNLQN
ncbi:T9SS type A sorting domain-containing protein [Dysgonomonas sp. GY75]|uniref:T9SS type A sorting domain-containing protein n=1 Tax=Dysgonomonas sp. GY75 TaxID=2780419 RepID=UPI001883A9C3|nr:T9SS type A sorting domain-containing protein [Dysgonomonas sp. GY75]MBF0649784.1 T9SS type A sorting domain-containing protein [Dysgonomonas sp. GY75]